MRKQARTEQARKDALAEAEEYGDFCREYIEKELPEIAAIQAWRAARAAFRAVPELREE